MNTNSITFGELGSKEIRANKTPWYCNHPIYWSSSNTGVATVSSSTSSIQANSKATITAKANGSCTIIASCNGKSASCNINVSTVLDNPTITVENYKIKLEQNGHVEYFDASYAANTKANGYHSNRNVSNECNLTLSSSNINGTKFKIGDLYPASTGYRNSNNVDGGSYDYMPWCYVACHNFNFTYNLRNVNVNSTLMNDALASFNASFSKLNVSINGNSNNSIEQGSYSDTWLGLNSQWYSDDYSPSASKFQIQLNSRELNGYYGNYNSSNRGSQGSMGWLETTVHELGHTLGFDDQATHLPTMYNYGKDIPDRIKCVYLQANDLYTLRYFLNNKYGVNLNTMSQKEIIAQVNSIKAARVTAASNDEVKCDRCFEYSYFNNDGNIIDNADVVVEAKLKFDQNKDINITEEGTPCILNYNIYDIEVENTIKGELRNTKLKLHPTDNLGIDENCVYKLYLRQYDNVPCSLINIHQGMVKINKTE